jgi:type I restriction enzyme S subunit
MTKKIEKYKLPAEWRWVKLEEITLPISRVNRLYENPTKEFSYIDIDSVNNSNQQIQDAKLLSWKEAPSRAQQVVKSNDILFATVRPYLKNIAIVPPEYNNQIASSGFCIIRACRVNFKYLFYYLSSDRFITSINRLAKGTSYPAVTNKIVLEQQIPLPPLQEQNRIVLKLEELLSCLEKGNDQLRTSLKQLDVYRQVVLKHAFEGKLTNTGIKNERLPKSWTTKKIDDLCDVVRGGSPRPAGDPRFYGGKIPFLKVADITNDEGMFLYHYQHTITEAGLKKTRQIKPNTLLISNSGATLGVPKICMIDATMNDGIAAFLNLDERSTKYLYYFWKSKTKELRSLSQGAAQPNLNTSIIKNYLVPYCSFEEQSEVVDQLELKFSKTEKLEEDLNKALKETEHTKNAILKRAFTGTLIERDLSDQPVIFLLKEIKAAKDEFVKAGVKSGMEQKQLHTKYKKMAEELKGIMEILAESKEPVSAKTLWQSSTHKDDIDEFYAVLKKHVEIGEVIELPRKGKESFLKLAQLNENR